MLRNVRHYYQKLKGTIMHNEPKMFDPATARSWNDQRIFAVAAAFGHDPRQAALDFLATVPQADVTEALICRPEPSKFDGKPTVPVKVKT